MRLADSEKFLLFKLLSNLGLQKTESGWEHNRTVVFTQNITHMKKKDLKQYWKKNLQYLAILLSIWFLSSYCLGILFVEELNSFRMGGFKVGFWFAQQGSIYVFIGVIFTYVYLMNKLDKEFEVDEIAEPTMEQESVAKKYKDKETVEA